MTNSNFSLLGISCWKQRRVVNGTVTTLQAVEMLLFCFIYSDGEKPLSILIPESALGV